MDIRLTDVIDVRQTRGGISLKIEGLGDYCFTEEQFLCFHEAIRYVVENYDDHIHHHGLGYDVIRPEYLHWGEDRFELVLPWEANSLEQLEKNLQRIDRLLGFYYRETEFVYLPPYMDTYTPPHNDLLVCVRNARELSLDIGFVFRREGEKRYIVAGHLRRFVEADHNTVYDSIEPFERLRPWLPYVVDLLGGVTETNSLPEVGYDLALECGLGQLTLGRPTKEDLKVLQRKLMK